MSDHAVTAPEAEEAPRKQDVFEGYDPAVKVRTKKMLMYFIIFAIVMLFGGFTSAMLVMYGGSYWVHITPPTSMWMSLVFLGLSSLTLFLAHRLIKGGKQTPAFALVVATFALGIGFTVTQWSAWNYLSERGMGVTQTVTEAGEKTTWNNIDEIQGEYGVDFFIYKGTKENRLVLDKGEYYFASDTLRTEPLTDDIRAQSNLSSSMVFVLLFAHVVHLLLGLIYLIVNGVRIRLNRITADNSISLYVNGMYWHFMGILWVYLFLFLFVFH